MHVLPLRFSDELSTKVSVVNEGLRQILNLSSTRVKTRSHSVSLYFPYDNTGHNVEGYVE